MPTFFHHRARYAAFLCALFLALFVSGCAGGGNADPYSKSYTAREINANPALLNSTIVKGSDLSGLKLSSVHIKDATFFNTTSSGAHFRNVIFDNCRFINAKFDKSVLENVTFKGGIITCELDAYNFDRRTEFTNARFTNLVFDGTYLENTLFQGNDGSVTIRNVHQAIATHPIIMGANVRLVLENSLFRNMTIAELVGKSTLKASHCTFQHAFFGNSTFVKTEFYKNISHGGPIYQQPARRR